MTNASLAGMSLMARGLITTVCGLAGECAIVRASYRRRVSGWRPPR